MDTPMGSTGFNTNTGADTPTATGGSGTMASTSSGVCPTCGQSQSAAGGGIDQFLGRLGISEEMVSNLKNSMQNIDVEEYLNTARDYLKGGSSKATTYAKENPGKVAAGVAVLAVGAGLLISSLNRD